MAIDPGLITVAICSLGDAGESLDACLASLAAAGVGRPIVLTASEGMASLRNQALVQSQTPVLAFVDDDVVVEPDWLEVLSDAWSSAPARVASIGGPIATRAHREAPGWVSDELAGTLCPGTPKQPTAELTARDLTLCGGNLSFRADALRGAGGFWPVRGYPGLRDLYSEEHHAQWELFRVGWSAMLDSRLKVTRAFGARQQLLRTLRQQLTAGARNAELGGNGGHRERRATAKAALSTARAAVTLDRGRAAEEAVKTARLAGTLAPARFGAASLEATEASTPFRHSIPVPEGWRRPGQTASHASPAVLAYHRVSDDPSPAGLAVTREEFRSQMAERLARGPAVPLAEIVSGESPRDAFAVTFDDGYADNLHVVLPILEELGVPATFFITTGHVISGKHFWWDQVARLMPAGTDPSDRPPLVLPCRDGPRAWAPSTPEETLAARRHVAAWLQSMAPEDVGECVNLLAEWAGPGFEPNHPSERPLTPAELAELADSPLATIGAHTRTHINLAFCPAERLGMELAGSREDLKDLCGVDTDLLAYPFGIWGADVNEAAVAAAEASGFSVAVLNGLAPQRGQMTVERIPVAAG